MLEKATLEHADQLLMIWAHGGESSPLFNDYVRGHCGVSGGPMIADRAPSELNRFKAKTQRHYKTEVDAKGREHKLFERSLDGYFLTARGTSTRVSRGSNPPALFEHYYGGVALERLNKVGGLLDDKFAAADRRFIIYRYQDASVSLADLHRALYSEYSGEWFGLICDKPITYLRFYRIIARARDAVASVLVQQKQAA